ncbi:RadC family protein [Pararhodobacter sp.]|uniref:RadC family protein n=1 Tax=Pararhodobacter sp. TaxID=2127056 RepID=UPI002AFE7FA2|nr:DNA repair protein RadC [Pararhodobacter sp.]
MSDPRAFAEMPLPLFAPQAQVADRKPAKPPSYLADHRKRLRSRFLQGGPEAMPDYELLELLLFGAVLRQDVKPLARRLLDHFGDLATLIAASPTDLQRVEGVGEGVVTVLKLAGAVAGRIARAKVMHRPVISSWSAMLDYCHTVMAHRDIEHFRVLFLDRKNCLIADEELGRGTVDHVPVYPREIMRRALEVGASAMILVHNHPSGDPTPSQADIAMTDRIHQGAEALSLVLHDHLIIGQSREFSFRSEGLL